MGKNGPSMVIHVCDEAKKCKNLNAVTYKTIIVTLARKYISVIKSYDVTFISID